MNIGLYVTVFSVKVLNILNAIAQFFRRKGRSIFDDHDLFDLLLCQKLISRDCNVSKMEELTPVCIDSNFKASFFCFLDLNIDARIRKTFVLQVVYDDKFVVLKSFIMVVASSCNPTCEKIVLFRRHELENL